MTLGRGPRGERGTNDPSVSRDGFRWTCPFCGTSRLNTSGADSGEQNGVAALRSHVLASEGADHGPVDAYPAGFDPDTLSDHVVQLDRRDDPVKTNG